MLSQRHLECLKGIGIRQWVKRSTIPVASTEILGEPVIQSLPDTSPPLAVEKIKEVAAQPAPVVIEENLDGWDNITASIHQCTACELAANCTQKVPGVGNLTADLMIIGEGPGHDEDIKGEPFVGRSGILLDKMLATIGFSRAQVFITNIVKCRPPNNRDPRSEEVKQCSRFLSAQIAQIKPKIILSVGRISAHSLLDSSEPVGKLIPGMHRLPESDIPLKVTYHPAYLLRNPAAKAIVWNDLKTVYQFLHND